MKKWNYTENISLGYDENGKRVRARIYSKTKSGLNEERRRKENEWEELQKQRKDPFNHCPYTFEQYKDKWFESYKQTVTPNTIRMYNENIFPKLKPIESKKLNEITLQDLKDIINAHMSTPSICRQLRLGLKSIFNQAVEDGIIAASPAAYLKLPKKPIKDGTAFSNTLISKTRPLTEDEKEATKKTELDPMDRAFINCLYYFGLRPGEALALKKSDFHFDEELLYVTKAITDIPKSESPTGKNVIIKETKNNLMRKIPMHRDCIKPFQKYLKNFKKDDFIFTNKFGELLSKSSRNKMWTRIKSKLAEAGTLGENFRPYIYRHNFATILYYSQFSIKKAAELMGHKNPDMILKVYAHLDDAKEPIEALKSSDRF